jgi:hypothetical protein
MDKFKRLTLVGAALALLFVTGTLMNTRKVAAQGPPSGLAVNIVSPLPVPVTGSTTVSGTVAATQSGIWNMGITGQPSVNVANTPTVGLASGATVLVGNSASSPVSVAVNNSSQAFQQSVDMNWVSGPTETVSSNIVVPSGKRWVIEYVSGQTYHLNCAGCGLDVPPTNFYMSIDTSVNGVVVRHYIPFTQTAYFNPISFVYLASGRTELYADGGSTVVVTAHRVFNGYDGKVDVSLSGYLTPM